MSVSAMRSESTGVTFEALDLEFARLMERLSGGSNAALRGAAALVSRQRAQGDVCLELRRAAGTSVELAPGESVTLPELSVWRDQLQSASVVGGPGAVTPLILDSQDRLYLRRYWWYEQEVSAALEQRIKRDSDEGEPDRARLRVLLDTLFPTVGRGVDWQRVAAFAATRRRLCLISGGPGTGKTTTVVRILALLLELSPARALRIAVTAPTGKAAARLQDSLRLQKTELEARVASAAGLPTDVETIHRLLGARPGSPYFRHDSRNPLPVDILVVDEASMVDLALMAKLLLAVPPHARVLLLGDKDQLASVEAGNVLGDLSADPELNRFTADFIREYSAAGGPVLPARSSAVYALSDVVIQLQRSHRFSEGSGIQRVSAAVNRGDADRVLLELERCRADASGGVLGRPVPGRHLLREALRSTVIEGFGALMRAADAEQALLAMTGFRVLAAVRDGPYGVAALNALMVELLDEAGLVEGAGDGFRGRQVMVTSNDYSANLFNGDLGVVWPDERGRPMVWFPSPDRGVRRVSPARLPAHETAFALTVHKSQGSEFESVLLILPDRVSRVLTRELVYTGLTRARERTEVWFSEAVLREAIGRRTERASGLRDRLWRKSAS